MGSPAVFLELLCNSAVNMKFNLTIHLLSFWGRWKKRYSAIIRDKTCRLIDFFFWGITNCEVYRGSNPVISVCEKLERKETLKMAPKKFDSWRLITSLSISLSHGSYSEFPSHVCVFFDSFFWKTHIVV